MTPVTILIQARMGASRFPGKVLAPLAGKPVLRHLVDAVDRAGLKKSLCVAIPYGDAEEPLRAYCQSASIRCVQATKDYENADVLSRLYFATMVFGTNMAHNIVRLTADCPLLDHRVLLDLLNSFDCNRHKYAGQVNSPDGSDVEVTTYYQFREAHKNAKDKADREHVTPWIQRLVNFVPPKPDPKLRFSVDTVDDLRRCEKLLAAKGAGASWQDYIDALKAGV